MRWGLTTLLLLVASTASADDKVDPCACSPNKPHFHRASALTGGWGGERQSLLDLGIKINGTYAPELFAAPGLSNHKLVEAGLANLSIDVDGARLIRDGFGTLHLSVLGIHGHGISEELMDVYGVSNNAAPRDIRLFEAWYEQPIGPLTIRAGTLSADQEFILADHSTVLLSGTFGIIALLSYNVAGRPVYPYASPAVSARVEADNLTVRAAVYDTDAVEARGVPTQLRGNALAIGEVRIAELVQIGAWHNTLSPTTDAPGRNGYYGIIDHDLDEKLGAFARVAIAPDAPVSEYIDSGVRLRLDPWRPKDFSSAAVAFAKTTSGTETLLEMTYQYLVRGWLTVQPDAQLVLQHDRGAVVFATRAVIAL